jgi:hypothetical protein
VDYRADLEVLERRKMYQYLDQVDHRKKIYILLPECYLLIKEWNTCIAYSEKLHSELTEIYYISIIFLPPK